MECCAKLYQMILSMLSRIWLQLAVYNVHVLLHTCGGWYREGSRSTPFIERW